MEEDILLNEAIEIAEIKGKIRSTILQLKLRIGYNRANKIMQQIEDKSLFVDGKTGVFWSDRTLIK